MTVEDALRSICAELGMDESDVIGYLEYAHSESFLSDLGRGFVLDDAAAKLHVGTRKFRSVVRAAERHHMLRQVTVFVPTGECARGGFDGWLVGLGVAEEGESLPDFSTKRAVVNDASEWQRRYQEALQRAWFPEEIEAIVDLFVDENKTGKSEWRRVYTAVVEPLMRLQDEGYPREVVGYALGQTVVHGVGNANYARAVAKNQRKKAEEETQSRRLLHDRGRSFRLDDGTECDEYDTWCLKDPRYRERYIATFGERDG